jgi:effector-binding domain-containing protein
VVDVEIREIDRQPIAVARRPVTPSSISAEMIPGLDAVWRFVHAKGLETGHNVAVYTGAPDGTLNAWFGVEVAAPFDGDCSIDCAWMPVGLTAVATHVGPYDGLGATHHAVREWCVAHGYDLSGTSWEIYGDAPDDPTKLVTTVGYFLA